MVPLEDISISFHGVISTELRQVGFDWLDSEGKIWYPLKSFAHPGTKSGGNKSPETVFVLVRVVADEQISDTTFVFKTGSYLTGELINEKSR